MSASAATLGQRLKAERERKALSAQKAADELHLDAWVIEALESGDYARIGPMVYAKGHLKHYADLLGLPAVDVVEAYATPSPTPAAKEPPPRFAAGELRGTAPWAAAAGVAAVCVAAGWVGWRPWHPRLPAARVAPAPTANAAAADESALTIRTALGPMAVSAATTAVPAEPLTTAFPALTAVGAGPARLRLSFSADSWVDVHDAAGRRLYAGSGRANSVKVIAGAAPLTVYLGFASGVQMEVNNRVVAIGRQFLAGNGARFEAGADGVLRRDAHAVPAGNPHPSG